jgi:hypothetical protein
MFAKQEKLARREIRGGPGFALAPCASKTRVKRAYGASSNPGCGHRGEDARVGDEQSSCFFYVAMAVVPEAAQTAVVFGMCGDVQNAKGAVCSKTAFLHPFL